MLERKKRKGARHLVDISATDLIMPYFVIEGKCRKSPVTSMPGICRLSIDNLLKDIRQARRFGIKKVLLFGVSPPKYKDTKASYAYSAEGIVPQAVTAIKRKIKDITVITDVCLCAYTSHGHCGIIEKTRKKIDKESTLDALSHMGLMHAQAGADWVAPSAMAEGQVLAIRKTLDKHGYGKTKIMGYSAKFASNFYGPFREAASSAPKFGDRSGYQLNFRDSGRALKEIAQDIKEGADIVMVKPALSYLDIIKEASLKFKYPLATPGHIGLASAPLLATPGHIGLASAPLLAVPRRIGSASTPLLAAFNVSGEYAFVKYGAKNGLWDEKRIVFEIITAIKRSGADLIISYHAKDMARWLDERK